MTDLDKMAREILTVELDKQGQRDSAADVYANRLDDVTRAAVSAIRSALLTAPPGYVLVPVEPTEGQVEEGAKAIVSWEDGSVWPESWGQAQASRARREVRKVYAATMAAAPEVK